MAALAAQLLEVSPDAVIIVDGDGVIRAASPALETLFGYKPEELDGQPVEVLVPDALRIAHQSHRSGYLERATARPMGMGLELFGQRRDGSTVPVDIALAPLIIGSDRAVAAFVRDATERRRTESVLRDMNEISRQLLADRPLDEILTSVAGHVRALVAGVSAWVVVPDERGGLEVAAADGAGAQSLVGAGLPLEGSHSGRVMDSGEPLMVDNLTEDAFVLAPARQLDFGPGMFLPMTAEQGAIGTLVIARLAGQPVFSESDVDVARLFASSAAVVLAVGRTRAEIEALKIGSEHERIARDLHDTVIQRLFAIGMGLQSVQRRAEGLVADRIDSAVDSLDAVIRDIRETIFDLNRPVLQGPDLRQRVGAVTADAADQLGFRPRVTYRGPVEVAVGEEAAGHLLAVLREALSNAARHARARTVHVLVAADETEIVLQVTDDGIGISPAAGSGNGRGNMADRARTLGGTFRYLEGDGSGTALEWRVPVTREEPS